MTALLVALLVVVGAVAVLNLLLTVGVIRRLREHTQRLSTLGAAPVAAMLAAGQRVGAFAATTTDGEPVTRDLLSGPTLVGVFTPGCGACEERLPDFLTRARDFPGGRAQVLAVVAGEAGETTAYRDRLTGAARVVVEPPAGGPLATALEVSAFPAFGLLDADGVVVASGLRPDDLPVGSPAAT